MCRLPGLVKAAGPRGVHVMEFHALSYKGGCSAVAQSYQRNCRDQGQWRVTRSWQSQPSRSPHAAQGSEIAMWARKAAMLTCLAIYALVSGVLPGLVAGHAQGA